MQAEANLDQTVLDIVDARVGTVIRNKWHVDALVGTGGMAAVYAATHRNGNRVALKVLHLPLSIDQALSKRFKREGYAANAVQHPGVVRVLDDDVTEDGAAFLVMELLDGETAHHRAERLGGRLPVQDALTIIDGVLDILATAHGSGIVHRDIKPENIFFTRDRTVKLFDFGIARLRNAEGSSLAAADFPRSGPASHTAAAMGTPAFMPPEQALGHMDKVDALSDVWATGATMYTLLSGRLVHEYETANEVLIAAATRSALSLAEVAPDVAPEIVEVVDRALAYDKVRRWSSAKAMQHALRAAEESLSSSWGRISLVAAEASGSHPRISRVSVPEVAWRDTLSRVSRPLLGQLPLPGQEMADTTGAELSISVAKPAPKRRGWLVAATSGLLLALALVATFVVIGRMRPPAAPSVAAESRPAPPPPIVSHESEPPVASATPVDLELTNSSPAATGKGTHRSRKPPPPREPPREKTWLDRRK